MSEWMGGFFEKRFGVQPERTVRVVHTLGIMGAALLFSALATLVMAFNAFFVDQSLATLNVGDPAPRDIIAPQSTTYISAVLTEQGRQNAVNAVEDIYDLPDPNVARQQTTLARRILDFVNNVRRDPYASLEQKASDISQITALGLTANDPITEALLELNDDTWRLVDEQIISVLERVYQQSIRDSDVETVINRLPNQVSLSFQERESRVVTEIVGDLVRPNTFVNTQETDAARETAAREFQPVERTFLAGQIVVGEGNIITAADYEALQQLGLLEVSAFERRQALLRAAAQSFVLSVIIMIVIGLFISRFHHELYQQPRFILLAAAIYLLFLAGARVIGVSDGELYIYPTTAMALLFVAIIGPEVAIITTLGLAVMMGFMIGQRLEVATLVTVSGLIGTLSLRRAERLNSYFFAGLMVALVNVMVVVVFNLGDSQARLSEDVLLPTLVLFGALNGVLSAAGATALMYLVTLLFNLPTGLRLVELSQPNQPLLQRLLRDAPGTYQHSLQVANLSEQATNAVGGNAELVRVAALYHDIGKALNAPFFVENQAEGLNPHDEMGDPYRSADIIIGHVTEGAQLARQNRIPQRVRDFINEHHGTTRVEYFYRQALAEAENPDTIDPQDFTYPGPIPQSRETAIMMLADSCESTVRARRPSNRQEIQEIVQGIIDARSRDGQLDDSGLTANNMKTIRIVFVDMLQAVFHPRINYPSSGTAHPATPAAPAKPPAAEKAAKASGGGAAGSSPKPDPDVPAAQKGGSAATVKEDDDVSPLPDVPPLPRRSVDADSSNHQSRSGQSEQDEGEKRD
jgi:cyclic-di-AMP phosphodiesterase PgpH